MNLRLMTYPKPTGSSKSTQKWKKLSNFIYFVDHCALVFLNVLILLVIEIFIADAQWFM